LRLATLPLTGPRFLFDTGTSPDGVLENRRRPDLDPGSIEAISGSHGHFDHTTGLGGLPVRPVGADHRRGRPDHWVRARLPAAAGLARGTAGSPIRWYSTTRRSS